MGRGADLSEPAQRLAQAAQLDPEPCAVGCIPAPRAECPPDQELTCGLTGPGFRQGTQEREQHGTPGERDHLSSGARRAPASVDDQVLRGEHGLHFLEQDRPFFASRDQPRGRYGEEPHGLLHFRRQRRDVRSFRRMPRALEGCARGPRA